MWPGGMCGGAVAGCGGGGPTTMAPSEAQPASTASAIRARTSTVIAFPVRFLTSVSSRPVR
jgi:hypothetical protein